MRKARYLVLSVLAITVFTRTDTIMIQTIGPLVVRNIYGIPIADVGVVSVVFACATLVSRYWIGTNVSLFSLFRVLSAGIGVLLVSLVIVYVAPDLAIFLLATTLGGLGYAIIMSLVVSLIGLWSNNEDRATNLSLVSVSLSIGLVVGPLLGEPVVEYLGLRAVYLFLATLAFVAFVLMVLNQRLFQSDLRERVIRSTVTHLGASVNSNIRLLFKNRAYLNTLLVNLAFSLSFAVLTAYGGIYAEESFGFSPARVQVVFLLFFGVSLTSRIMLSTYTRFGRPINADRWFITGLCFNIVGLVFIGTANAVAALFTGIILLAVPHAIFSPLSFIRIAHSVETSQLIMANTFFQAVYDLSAVIGPVAGVLLIPYLQLRGIWLVFSIMPVFAIWRISSQLKGYRTRGTGTGPN